MAQICWKLKFRTCKRAKNDIFWPFEFAKIWFHVKSEWQANSKISRPCCLNFTFWKFLEHSGTEYLNSVDCQYFMGRDEFILTCQVLKGLKYYWEVYNKFMPRHARIKKNCWMAGFKHENGSLQCIEKKQKRVKKVAQCENSKTFLSLEIIVKCWFHQIFCFTIHYAPETFKMWR